MQFSLLPISLLVSLAAAQSSSSPSTACAAQPVLEACLASTQAIAQGCGTNDFQCLCPKYTEVLTCFNQCPNDARQASILSLKATYCSNASVYTSSASAAISRAASSASSAAAGVVTNASNAANSASSAAGAVATSAGSNAAAAPSATDGAKSGADTLAIAAGSIVMGFAGLMAALL